MRNFCYYRGSTENTQEYGCRLNVPSDHELYDARSDIPGHIVVEAPPREDDLRMVADLFGFVGQVIRVDTDAMSADEPGLEV